MTAGLVALGTADGTERILRPEVLDVDQFDIVGDALDVGEAAAGDVPVFRLVVVLLA
jgi:hypothetical protein